MKNRNEKQIRSRYVNYLFKGIKFSKWQAKEDKVLLENFMELKKLNGLNTPNSCLEGCLVKYKTCFILLRRTETVFYFALEN